MGRMTWEKEREPVGKNLTSEGAIPRNPTISPSSADGTHQASPSVKDT